MYSIVTSNISAHLKIWIIVKDVVWILHYQFWTFVVLFSCFFLCHRGPCLKLGDKNQVISQFYLAQFDDGKLFTVNHFVTSFFLILRSIYRMLKKVDKIYQVGQKTLDWLPGSRWLQALTGQQEKVVLKEMENKKDASIHRQSHRFIVTPCTILNIPVVKASKLWSDRGCWTSTRKK